MMRTFIPFTAARQCVVDAAALPSAEHVFVGESLGRTLAEDILSPTAIPRFDNTAMDGFAVCVSDIEAAGTRLRIAGEVMAGDADFPPLGTGTAIAIMTGAPIPPGCDAVVPIEKTRTTDRGLVEILNRPSAGDHIRRKAGDVEKGMRVLEKGIVITPPIVGMIANLGLDRVTVSKEPSVAVISTGNELVEPGQRPGPSQIWNSNGTGISAQVRSAGGCVHTSLHAIDDSAAIQRSVEAAMGADILLFSGGVSMGKYDLVRSVLEDMGTKWEFWKVRQRPGKPLVFGMFEKKVVLGLPGNPVSAAMCFEQYVRPLLATQLQRTQVYRPLLDARLSRPIKKNRGLYYFARGVIGEIPGNGYFEVTDTGPQGSHLYSSVVRANAIIHLPEELENPDSGTAVKVERLSW